MTDGDQNPVEFLNLDCVDSTNDEARRRVDQGLTGPLWITAKEQRAGRGRYGRTWVSPPGNLYTTVVDTFVAEPSAIANLSFVAALSIHDVVASVAGSDIVALKWPNDVLLRSKKVSGILLENLRQTGLGGQTIAIGFGMNLTFYPSDPGAGWPGTSILAETGVNLTPAEAVARLAAAYAKWAGAFRSSGFTAIRSAWLDRAAHLGQEIEVRLPNQTMRGRFRKLDADGVLVLETPDGVRRIAAGDVFFAGASHAACH